MEIMIIKMAAQILFLTCFFYYFYTSLNDNKASGIAHVAISYTTVFLICYALDLSVLKRFMEILMVPVAVFLCVLYQPELRRAFTSGFMKKNRLFSMNRQNTSAENVDSIMSACQQLIQSKRGALIVFPRNVSIKNVIESGTKLNADISTALIVTVFNHDTALHDGAMIIQGAKIVAAGCYLPLSSQMDIRQSFGTRHRAGLGMAEESDAAVLIVSEETGAISLAYNTNLYYNLDAEVVKNTLLAIFNNVDIQLDLKDNGYEIQ